MTYLENVDPETGKVVLTGDSTVAAIGSGSTDANSGPQSATQAAVTTFNILNVGTTPTHP